MEEWLPETRVKVGFSMVSVVELLGLKVVMVIWDGEMGVWDSLVGVDCSEGGRNCPGKRF